MINGKLNDCFQSVLNNQRLNEFEVLDINASKNEIILVKKNQKFICKIIQKDSINQSFIIKINGHISSIKLVKSIEQTIEKLGINRQSHQNTNSLKAPMPGLILELLVQKGDIIQKGDPLVILEAMKMENILYSPADGIINDITVKPQQTVEKNNILIKFEP